MMTQLSAKHRHLTTRKRGCHPERTETSQIALSSTPEQVNKLRLGTPT